MQYLSMNLHIITKNLNKNINNQFFSNNTNELKNKNFPSLYLEWSNFVFNYNKNNIIDSLLIRNFIIKSNK